MSYQHLHHYHHPVPSDDVRRMASVEEAYCDIHICSWEGQHCVEWASKVCQKRGVDANQVDLRGFSTTNGIDLQQLSRQEFCVLVGDQYGAMFWKELRSFRAQQTQRCPNCVSKDEIPALLAWSNSQTTQQTPSDLSSRSQQNSPLPRSNQDHTTSYTYHLTPGSYEVRPTYPDEEHSPPRSYEGSPSPGYQERVRSPEGYSSHAYLPPSPESYRSHSHSPQLLYPEPLYRKAPEDLEQPLAPPRKPLPELLLLEDLDESPVDHISQRTHSVDTWRMTDERPRSSYERVQSNQPIQVICSTQPGYPPYSAHPSHSTHHRYINQPTHRDNSGQMPDRAQITRIIQYAHPSHTTSHPAHITAHPRTLITHPIHRTHYTQHAHYRDPSITVYGSEDEEEEDDCQEEPGRLVIDLREDKMEIMGTETEEGPMLQAQENGPFSHLKKIPTKRRRDRGPKSWEFLMRLLACPETNPSIIRWEDESEASFRLVQPQEIANMWGARSNKEVLSYNNFARALRYHYKTKLLYRISERQLVYGCGPVALEFYKELIKADNKTSTPNSTG